MNHWDRVGLTAAPDTSDVDLSGVTTTGKCENPSQPLPGESGCSIPRVSRVVEVTPNRASVLVGHSGAEHVVVAQRRHAGIYDSKENLSKSQQPFLRKIY